MLGVGNVAGTTGVADVREMADSEDVTGLVMAGDVDTTGTEGSGAQGDELLSGSPGRAVFRRLPPLLTRVGLLASSAASAGLAGCSQRRVRWR